jgi:hypothetical protein
VIPAEAKLAFLVVNGVVKSAQINREQNKCDMVMH